VVMDRTIAVETHGRYLVEVPAGGGPWPLLVGFHGYAEAAEDQLARLRSSGAVAPAAGSLSPSKGCIASIGADEKTSWQAG